MTEKLKNNISFQIKNALGQFNSHKKNKFPLKMVAMTKKSTETFKFGKMLFLTSFSDHFVHLSAHK